MNLSVKLCRLIFPAAAALAVISCSSNNKSVNDNAPKSIEETVFERNMNYGHIAITGDYYEVAEPKRGIYDYSQIALLDTVKLNQLKDSVTNKTTRDSIRFVQKGNKTYQDTLNILESFRNRDKAAESVKYLKQKRIEAINKANLIIEREQAQKEQIKKEFNSYMQ